MTYPRRRSILVLIALATAVLSLGSLAVGPFPIEISAIVKSLANGWPDAESDDRAAILVWENRLPTLTTALLAGASLGAAGLLMQTFFRNPLAGPDVMGVSAGASLGVALVTLLGQSDAFVPHLGFLGQLGTLSAAVLGAAAVLGLALLAARWYDDSITLLVLGMMFA